MSGYIIPDNLQKDMTQVNKLDYGVARVILGTAVTDKIPNGSNNGQSGLAGRSSYFSNNQ